MKTFRLLLVSFLILLPGFTCIKRAGVQLNTYTLSDCPAAEYTLPNFSETEDLILTQDDSPRLSCKDYKGYTIMNKEKINNEAVDFMLKYDVQNSKCNITLLIDRYCSPGDPECLKGEKPVELYLYNIKQLIPEFLFKNQKISATETAAIIVTGQEYADLCKEND